MAHQVKLTYFRQTGKLLAEAEATVARDAMSDIWQEVGELRRLGRLPGLRPGSGRDLLILVDVPDHPQRELRLVMPPFLDEGDVTPPRVPMGELPPKARTREPETRAGTPASSGVPESGAPGEPPQ